MKEARDQSYSKNSFQRTEKAKSVTDKADDFKGIVAAERKEGKKETRVLPDK
jgi:hypothetical protein